MRERWRGARDASLSGSSLDSNRAHATSKFGVLSGMPKHRSWTNKEAEAAAMTVAQTSWTDTPPLLRARSTNAAELLGKRGRHAWRCSCLFWNSGVGMLETPHRFRRPLRNRRAKGISEVSFHLWSLKHTRHCAIWRFRQVDVVTRTALPAKHGVPDFTKTPRHKGSEGPSVSGVRQRAFRKSPSLLLCIRR